MAYLEGLVVTSSGKVVFAYNTYNSGNTVAVIDQIARAAMPVITPSGEFFITTPIEISITSSTPGANIYYTLDGTEPTSSSTLYTVPFNISANTVVKARAYDTTEVLAESLVATKDYRYQVSPVSASIAGGIHIGAQSLILTTETAGATIYYTTDGSTPSAASTEYTGAISLTVDTIHNIKAVAILAGPANSDTFSATYNLLSSVPAPVLSEAPDNSNYSTCKIQAGLVAPGAVTYWTKDGTEPSDSNFTNAYDSGSPEGSYYLEYTESCTIKAITYFQGYVSGVTTFAYVKRPDKPWASYNSWGETIGKITYIDAYYIFPDGNSLDLYASSGGYTPSDIRYTIDGSEPTPASPIWDSNNRPLNLLNNTDKTSVTIKAIVVDPNDNSLYSHLSTTIITYCAEPLSAPVIRNGPPPGEVTFPTNFIHFGLASGLESYNFMDTDSTEYEGLKFYYTTDGSTPTTSSILYDPYNGIILYEPTIIKVIAVTIDGYKTSDVCSFEYSAVFVPEKVATPVVTINRPNAPSWTASITCDTPDATFEYKKYARDGIGVLQDWTACSSTIEIGTELWTMLSVRASKDGMSLSDASDPKAVWSENVLPMALAPEITLGEMSMPGSHYITITCATPGVSVQIRTWESSEYLVSEGDGGEVINWYTLGTPIAIADSKLVHAVVWKASLDISGAFFAMPNATATETTAPAVYEYPSATAGCVDCAIGSPTPGAICLYMLNDGATNMEGYQVFSNIITVPYGYSIIAYATVPGKDDSTVVTHQVEAPAVSQVIKPELTVGANAGPEYHYAIMSCATEGASISYKLSWQGTPYQDWTTYTGQVSIQDGSDIEVKATKAGMTDSEHLFVTGFAVATKVETPALVIGAISESGKHFVTISDATPGSTIYYKLNDGMMDVTSYAAYTDPISVTDHYVVIAYATAPGYADSDPAQLWVWEAATPVITVLGVAAAGSHYVEITCETPESTIYYKLNDGVSDLTSYATYTSQIAVPDGVWVMAYANAANNFDSQVASARVMSQVETPVISSEISLSGTIGIKLTITCPTEGAAIEYSFDNSTWSAYSAPVYITDYINGGTLYARASKTEMTSSSVASKVIAPNINAAAGMLANDTVISTTGTLELSCPAGCDIVWASNPAGPYYSYSSPISYPDIPKGLVADANGRLTMFLRTTQGNDIAVGYEVTIGYAVKPASPVISESVEIHPVHGPRTLVVISCSDAETYKHYSFDGSNWENYVAPIPVTSQVTMYARTGKVGYTNYSEVVSHSYSLTPAPAFSHPDGPLVGSGYIVLTPNSQDDTILYCSYDGVATVDWAQYASPGIAYPSAGSAISISAVAYRPGFLVSNPLTEALYTYAATYGTVDNPVIAVLGASGALSRYVEITCSTPGATIEYRIVNPVEDVTVQDWTTYTGQLTVNNDLYLYARATKENWLDSSVISVSPVFPKVASPIITSSHGEFFEAGTEITITCATPGAQILVNSAQSDPADPDPANLLVGFIYSAPFYIPGDQTIKAIAFKDGMGNSDIASITVHKMQKLEAPTFSPQPEVSGRSYVFKGSTYVTIACSTPGATIKYVLNGKVFELYNGPNFTYTEPLFLENSTSIAAYASKENMLDSDSNAQAYQLKNLEWNTPQFSPADGTTFEGSQQVSISIPGLSDDYGVPAVLKYTLDGSDPSETNGNIYSSPITITDSCTVKVRALESYTFFQSPIAVSSYTKIAAALPRPTLVSIRPTTIAPGAIPSAVFEVTGSSDPTAETKLFVKVDSDYIPVGTFVNGAVNRFVVPGSLLSPLADGIYKIALGSYRPVGNDAAPSAPYFTEPGTGRIVSLSTTQIDLTKGYTGTPVATVGETIISGVTATECDINWSIVPPPDAVSYLIEVANLAYGIKVVVDNLPLNTTTTHIDALRPATNYTVSLSMVLTDGTKIRFKQASFKTLDVDGSYAIKDSVNAEDIAVPVRDIVVDALTGQVNWATAAANVTQYQMVINNSITTVKNIDAAAQHITAAEMPELRGTTFYTFVLKTFTSDGKVFESKVMQTLLAPTQPVLVRIYGTDNQPSDVGISFGVSNYDTSVIKQVNVYRRNVTDNGNLEKIKSMTPAQITALSGLRKPKVNDTTAVAGKSYVYALSFTNAAGEGPKSALTTAITAK